MAAVKLGISLKRKIAACGDWESPRGELLRDTRFGEGLQRGLNSPARLSG